VFERDGDGWLARVPEIQGCFTEGPTIEAARRSIREAIAVALDLSEEEASALEVVEEHAG
jgi:predicted RNase H-like HicB family nuclease